VTGNDAVLAIEKDRVRKPEFFEAARELIELRGRTPSTPPVSSSSCSIFCTSTAKI
jgi:hypothetical protein